MEEKKSAKHEEARNALPDELKSIFYDFVSDYKCTATCRHGAPYPTAGVKSGTISINGNI